MNRGQSQRSRERRRVRRSNGEKEIGKDYTIKLQKGPKMKVLLLDKI